ncbi:hypothetical protein Misp06_01800 [Microbulbifer sp. NBRC 101763]
MILLDFIQFVLVSKLRKIDRYLLVFWPELGGLLKADGQRPKGFERIKTSKSFLKNHLLKGER